MSDPVWYRSLYWRIAIGFVVLLAVLLAVQGMAFLWLTGRVAAAWPGRSASELASTIAADLEEELAARPETDIDAYVNGRYSSAFRSFVIGMGDGRMAYSRRVVPPPGIDRAVRTRLVGEGVLVPGRGGLRIDRGRGRRGGEWSGWRGFGRAGNLELAFSPIVVTGAQAGIVAVPVEPPPLSVAMRDLGPTLLTVGLGLLVAGTAVLALLVFRPTHRRLQALQQAARAVGSGETGVRAPASGGDEVAALALAFNEMAGQLEHRTQALETADRTRRHLVADVSHELTTPLSAIRGYVETLSMPGLPIDDATRARYLRIVGEETDRLEHIVGDLLDVARLEGGGSPLTIEDVSISQLFERLRHRHAQALEQKQIALETIQRPDTLEVRADAKRLEQALQNLVANALRHTPDGGRIIVSAARSVAGIRITVDDTGPGIPPEHLPHVFDRFYKVDVSRAGTTRPSGSGLGLSIVRAIVDRHGGTVTASNAPGSGARFEIWLPGHQRHEGHEEPEGP